MSFGHKLSFQWCRYLYDQESGGGMDYGYRFIWESPTRGLMAHRGQARIPSIKILESLIAKAKEEGWGDYEEGGKIPSASVETK